MTKLSAATKLSKVFTQPLTEDHLHIFVTLPAPVGHKRKRDDPTDVSRMLLEKWTSSLDTLPALGVLSAYLNEPLDAEEKVPLSQVDWRRLLVELPGIPNHECYDQDLELLFTPSEEESAQAVIFILQSAILGDPQDPSGTEDSLHSFWDKNIRDILHRCLAHFSATVIRNSSQDTNTGNLRPDFGLLLRLTCVFRGEEKRDKYSGLHPQKELAVKTRWVYQPAPYILGW